MAIRIIDDQPDIHLTRAEYDRLLREWQASQAMTAMPQEFEAWIRARHASRAQPVMEIANTLEVVGICGNTSLRVGKACVEVPMFKRAR